MSVINHAVIPDLVKANNTYAPLDLLDFNLNFQGRKMLFGTVRFQAQISIPNVTGVIPVVDRPDVQFDIKFDSMTGAGHSVIDTITTNVLNVGQVEDIQQYNRYHAMIMNATQSRNDTMNSYNSCEMKAPSDLYTPMMLKGVRTKLPREEFSDYTVPPDFSVKPSFCLNRTTAVDSDDNSVSFSKTGTVRISILLARTLDVLFGNNVSGVTTYQLINPRIIYQSIPDDGKQAKLQMRVEYGLRTSINSADTVISTRVPAVADGCSISFIPTSHESTAEYNNLAQETLPALSELVFLWNNASNAMVTYTIRDPVEVADRYIESLKSAGHNNASLQQLKANSSYGVGLYFGTFVNLANQSFNIQMACGVQNGNPFTAHLYFHGLIEL
jgi:hypothetical protein